jgi:hypothetical protein
MSPHLCLAGVRESIRFNLVVKGWVGLGEPDRQMKLDWCGLADWGMCYRLGGGTTSSHQGAFEHLRNYVVAPTLLH